MVAIETAFEPVVFQWKEEGELWDSREMLAIVTRMDFSAGTQEQLSPTIGGQLYLYVFGDKPSVLTMSGVAFDSLCDTAGGTKRSGFDQLLNYYERKKLSARIDPIRIVLGTQVVTAYLNGIVVNSEDAELHIWKFTLSFIVIPRIPLIGKSRSRTPVVGGPPAGGSGPAPSPPAIGPVSAPLDPGGAVIGEPVVLSPPDAGSKGYEPVGTGPGVTPPGRFVVDG